MQQSQQPFTHPFLHAMPELQRWTSDMLLKRPKLFFLFAIIALTWSGCRNFDSTDQEAPVTIVTASPINGISWRYLALGDSYTIGESVSASERWPNQLQSELEANLNNGPFDEATILATTGWTTNNLSQAFYNSGLEEQAWDLVSLLIGVNNQYQGASLEEYESEYENLLQRSIAAANGRADRVFVVSIPDYGYTPFGASNQAQISAELETFNAACKEITESYGVSHFNITDISQQWPELEGLVAADGLHPSGMQYAMWVESFQDEVTNLLAP
jgi:acyl-CoA thioesterase I